MTDVRFGQAVVGIAKRERVREWRVTTHLCGLTVRWWIESDPEYGGASNMLFARMRVAEAQNLVGLGQRDPDAIAAALLEACESANSIEVCDKLGDGVAMHRDWP
jgi:hypothetical protein